MSNTLGLGLVPYYKMLDVSDSGQHSLNLTNHGSCVFHSGGPVTGEGYVELGTDGNQYLGLTPTALLANLDATDVAQMCWVRTPVPGLSPNFELGEGAGSDTTYGIDLTLYGGPANWQYEVPGPDNSFSQFAQVFITEDTNWHMILGLYVALAKTLWLRVDGGSWASASAAAGFSPNPSPATVGLIFDGLGPGLFNFGSSCAWIDRGAGFPDFFGGDADALYNSGAGLPFSAFGSGGGGGVNGENCRASAMMVSLPWRGLLPQPDATIGLGDRVQTAFMYRCIAEPPFSGGGPDIFHAGFSPSAAGSRVFVRIGH